MTKSDRLKRFQEAIFETISTGSPSEKTKRAFEDDLISDAGAPNRQPFSELTGFRRFQRLALSFLAARSTVENASKARDRILRLRSLETSERLQIVQVQSWHHRYLLRERLRRLIDLLKTTPEGLPHSTRLGQIAAAYKQRSDKTLALRHRDVHEFDAHHPEIKQVELLELLSGPHVPDRNFAAVFGPQRRAVAARAVKVMKAELSAAEHDFLELTDEAFDRAFSLADRWTFPVT